MYTSRLGTRLLLGSGTIGDTAKGGKSHLTVGVSSQLLVAQTSEGRTRHVTLTNANRFPVAVELALGSAGRPAIERPSVPITRIDGTETWSVTVPADGTAKLEYSLKY